MLAGLFVFTGHYVVIIETFLFKQLLYILLIILNNASSPCIANWHNKNYTYPRFGMVAWCAYF